MFHGHLDYFQKPSLGGIPDTKLGDHATPNAHNLGLFYFNHAWRPAQIEIHWIIIFLRARSHMTSQYTWGSVTTLHDFWGVLGQPLDTFFWAPTISWSRLLARVWSGPKIQKWDRGSWEWLATLYILLIFPHIKNGQLTKLGTAIKW